MRLIGLAGPAGVGKDTIGRILKSKINSPHCKTIGFADNVKSDLFLFFKQQYNIDIFHCSREEKNRVRNILVAYAVQRREENPDYWINRLEITINDAYPMLRDVIITDVRYVNECNWIQNNGGECWYLNRKGFEPANEEELKSLPPLLNIVNKKINLPNVEDISELEPIIQEYVK